MAQATGEYTREELNKDGKLGWTDKAAAEIAQQKAAATGGGSSPSGGSESGNGGSQNGGSQSGQQGEQNQPTGYALTISKSGSGTATVSSGGNAVNSGASLNEDAEVELSITPAEGQTPTATINGSSIELTEDGGVYTGSFAMPAQASTLVINTGTTSGGDDQVDQD